MDNVPVGDNYDPTYKVKEMKEYLKNRYQQLFIPGQQLSLDETLIHAGQDEVVEHIPIKMQGEVRSRCAYCALLLRTQRTRHKCLACGVPLCSTGSGKVDDDCFAIAHKSLERRELVCKKFVPMQKRTIKNKLET
jgi:hypothetical protein